MKTNPLVLVSMLRFVFLSHWISQHYHLNFVGMVWVESRGARVRVSAETQLKSQNFPSVRRLIATAILMMQSRCIYK